MRQHPLARAEMLLEPLDRLLWGEVLRHHLLRLSLKRILVLLGRDSATRILSPARALVPFDLSHSIISLEEFTLESKCIACDDLAGTDAWTVTRES